ncbi:MAG: UDP-N-acetylglucosamine 2-epimerase (non-hydrolyzing) [Candidatus Paceibacterota bacterium]
MRVLTIVGARPQFVKAAVVSRQFCPSTDIEEILVHTGQHYDERMSQIFFDELEIPAPAFNLQSGSGRHGRQTGKMLAAIEELIISERPDAVLVYGDTNSTLSGALAAAKLQVPVAHVEAGLRSFNRQMPEEVNRVLTDHISQLLLCPTQKSLAWLKDEGITENVHLVGDVMYDAVQLFTEFAERHADPLADFQLSLKSYILMTCHRAENTDDAKRFQQIMDGVAEVAKDMPVVFPVHPRTRGQVDSWKGFTDSKVIITPPVSYFEMLLLQKNAAAVLTDSGGMQKEAFFFGVPCITARDETEWTETVDCGANKLVGASTEAIVRAVKDAVDRPNALPDAAPYYGNGKAAETIARLVADLARSPQNSASPAVA